MPNGPSTKNSTLLSIILIILLGLAAYANSLNNAFIWDDNHLVTHNEYIKDWSHLPDLLAGKASTDVSWRQFKFYRPVQMISYAIDYSLWKVNPKGYHLTNVLLHVLAALSVFWLVQLMTQNGFLALVTGIFFVIHPVHTEAVTYIAGRADALALLFMSLCFVFYIKQVSVFMIVSFALALLSRENSLILPLLILIYHYSFKIKINKPEFSTLVIMAVAYIVLRMTLLSGLLTASIQTTTLVERIPGFLVAVVSYIQLLFLPLNLHMEYGIQSFQWGEAKVILGLFLLTGLLIYAFKKREQNPLFIFSVLWFFVALLPVSNLYPINAYMAEHWLYVPSVGFFLIIAQALHSLSIKGSLKTPILFVIAGLVMFYVFLTFHQNTVWRDPITFFERTAKFVPEGSRVYYNLGNAYYADRRYQEAQAAYEKAVALKADYAEAYNNLGIVKGVMGQTQKAIDAYKKSLTFDPNRAGVYYNLGSAYGLLQRHQEAQDAYKKAIVLHPDYAEAYNNLGNIYDVTNRKDEAIAAFKKAVEIKPRFGDAYKNLAVLYYQKQDYRAAIQYCDQAVKLGSVNPTLIEALKPYR